MKKLTLALILIIFLFNSVISSAQNIKRQSTVTAGVGQSLVGILFSAIKASTSLSSVDIKSTPPILLSYDYALGSKFSLGLAGSYQNFSVHYTNQEYKSSAGYTGVATWKDAITRTNFGLRPLFHLSEKQDLDMYLGARLSFTQWNYNTTNPDPTYVAPDAYAASGRVKFQALFGVRYYFTPNIGINGELAIGPSYFAMIGASFRFPAEGVR